MKSCMVSNYLQRDGFNMVSNLLIDYQQKLGISNTEFNFIIKATKHKENYKLHDDQLDPTVSTRTLQRCRKSLTEKGYLNYKVWKFTDEKGHIHTEGITYDFSPLEEKLQEISNYIAEQKESQINKEAENYIIEFGETSPMMNFLEAWENHYGDKYKISPLERNWYNSLTSNEQERIGRIFDYFEEYNLFREKLVPRLSLFMKTKIRWAQLKEYCENNPIENIISDIPDDYEEEPFFKLSPEDFKKKEVIKKEEKTTEESKKSLNGKGFDLKKFRKIEELKKEIEETENKLKSGNLNDIEEDVFNMFLKDKLEELKNLGEQ